MGSFLSRRAGNDAGPEAHRARVLGRREGRAADRARRQGTVLRFSGGISIKPAQGMEWMKFDMCGAAGVLGAMEAIGRMELPINVVGLIGSTTNMPSGEAVKPGDVVQASNGKYIEIINTDAEGRLVLADVLVVREAILAGGGDRRRDADRRVRHRARPHGDGRHGQRRGVGAGSAGRGQAVGRARLAAAAVGRLQGADQVRRRRHQEFRRTPGGNDHRRAVPARSSPKAIHGCISTSRERRTPNRISARCRAVRPAFRWGRSSNSFEGACADALARSRVHWRCSASASLAGAVLHAPARRAGPRHASQARARHDASTIPDCARRAPIRCCATASRERDSIERERIRRDTIKAPLAHAELPVGSSTSRGDCHWNRDSLFATGAITRRRSARARARCDDVARRVDRRAGGRRLPRRRAARARVLRRLRVPRARSAQPTACSI